MIASEVLCKTFEITGQSAESPHPCETSLDDPSSRQEDEALLGFGQFDDREFDALIDRVLAGFLPSITLIGKGQMHALAGGLLHRLAEFARLELAPVRLPE